MWQKQFTGAVIKAVILVLVIDLFSYLIIFIAWPFIYFDSNSMRYLLSSISQSLAAIFALVAIVLTIVVTYTSKDVAKFVLKYTFEKNNGIYVISIFILSLFNNFIFLSLIDDGISLLAYSSVISNNVLFLISFISLVVFVYYTIKLAIKPFYSFFDEVKAAVLPSLQAYIPFLENRLRFDDLLIKKHIQWSLEWVSEGKIFVRSKNIKGHVINIDRNCIRQAKNILDQYYKEPIDCFVEYGHRIGEKGNLFAFKSVNPIVDLQIERILLKSISTQNTRPGWVPGLDYLAPTFIIAKEQILNPRLIDEYIKALGDIGELYLSIRKDYLGKYDEVLKNYDYLELLDQWFMEMHDLVKKACITKRELESQDKLLSYEDRTDIYPLGPLHRIAYASFKHDCEVYFNKSLKLLNDYAYFSTSTDKEINDNRLKMLNAVLMNISTIAIDELKLDLNTEKIEKYGTKVIKEYLSIIQNYQGSTMHTIAFRKFRRIKSSLHDDIKDKYCSLTGSQKDKLYEYFDKMLSYIFGFLFALSVYQYKRFIDNSGELKIFKEFIIGFRQEIKRIGRYQYDKSFFIEPIMDRAIEYAEDLRWFINMVELDDLIEEPDTYRDSEIKTNEYCNNVYFMTLCWDHERICISKEYWAKLGLVELKIYFDRFKISAFKSGSPINSILKDYFDSDEQKIEIAIKAVEDSVTSLCGGHEPREAN